MSREKLTQGILIANINQELVSKGQLMIKVGSTALDLRS